MIYSEDCLPGSCPLGKSKHEKLLVQVLAWEENLVVLDHWMTLFLGPAINFHLTEDFWLSPTVRVNAITFVLIFWINYSTVQISLSLVGVIKVDKNELVTFLCFSLNFCPSKWK